MNTYLLLDVAEDKITSVPICRIIASDIEEALLKAITGMVKDKILSISDICECLDIDIKDITELNTYE
jgi:hypothetical protein